MAKKKVFDERKEADIRRELKLEAVRFLEKRKN
jgi:hypothetical protein